MVCLVPLSPCFSLSLPLQNLPLRNLTRYVTSRPLAMPPRHGPYHYIPTEWICIIVSCVVCVVVCIYFTFFPSSWCSTVSQLVRILTVNNARHSWVFSVFHLGQAVKYRLWWMIPTATFAGILGILGWSARLWSSRNLKFLTPYEMQ